jgi:hypothetical protein
MKLLLTNYTLLKNYGSVIIAGELLLVLKVHVCQRITDCTTSSKYWWQSYRRRIAQHYIITGEQSNYGQ